MRILITLFLLLWIQNLAAQNHRLLDKYFDETLTDHERVQSGLNWALTDGLNHLDTAFLVVRQIESGHFKITNENYILQTEFLHLYLDCFKNQRDILPEISAKYEASKKSNSTTKKAYWANMAAYEYQKADRYPEAVKLFLEAIPLFEEIDDKFSLANIHRNLSFIYGALDNIDECINSGLKGIELFKELADTGQVINLYARVGPFYLMKGDTTSADNMITEAEKLAEEFGDEYWINFCRGSRSEILNAQQKYNEAYESLLLTLEYDKKRALSDPRALSFTYMQLCQVLVLMEQPEKAITFGEEGLKITEEYGLKKEKLDNLQMLHEAYYNSKLFKKAYDSYHDYIELTNEIRGAASMASVQNQMLIFETEKKALADSLQQVKIDYEKDLLHQKEVADQKRQKSNVAIVLVVLMIGAIGLIVVIRKTKKKNQLLNDKNETIEHQKNEILDSIRYAKRIQSAILPPESEVQENLNQSFILYKPKDIVAGDFYWMYKTKNKIIFAAADCTGHGVPGALVSVVCNNALNRSVKEFDLTDPGEILNKTREIVISEFEKSTGEDAVKDGMDIAICSLDGLSLEFAGAHNPLWLVRNEPFTDKKFENAKTVEHEGWHLIEIKADKQPIGKSPLAGPFTTHKIALKPKDRFYVFSDGYADQFGGEAGKKFKSKSFKQLLLSIQSENMMAQKKTIDEQFEEWKGKYEQLDDVCVIGVEV